VGRWVARLAEHGCGTALLHARTEAGWFEPIWQHATAILFMADRIKFCRPDGTEQPANSGAPPILAAFGNEDLIRLRTSGIPGALVTAWQQFSHDAEMRPRRIIRAIQDEQMTFISTHTSAGNGAAASPFYEWSELMKGDAP
jgi:hypothetical protein